MCVCFFNRILKSAVSFHKAVLVLSTNVNNNNCVRPPYCTVLDAREHPKLEVRDVLADLAEEWADNNRRGGAVRQAPHNRGCDIK